MAERFGTDTARLFALFAAPPEKDLDWQDSGVDGMHRFLSRVYRFVTRNAGAAGNAQSSAADRQVIRKLHQTIRKATEDFETRWHFNTSIAGLMELVNEATGVEKELSRDTIAEVLEKLVLLLGPFAPYLAEELWEDIGRKGPVFRQPWPAFDEALAKEDEVEVVLQVNGKVRGRLLVPSGTPKEELERRGMEDSRVQQFAAGKQVVKIVVVPEKLVNVVVR
jgi:leucyl-tRNA synthetase